MRNPVEIENIDERRRGEGIDDIELRTVIRGLRAGAFVKLTLLSTAGQFETLSVRITSIKGSTFRGKLADKPTVAGLSKLKVGVPLVFTTAHIHSLAREPHAHA